MFGSDEKKTLEKKYQQLLEEAYRLSHSNRKRSDLKSDLKRAEAEDVLAKTDALEKKTETK